MTEWAVSNPEAGTLLWMLSICVVTGGVLLIFHFVERAVDIQMVKAVNATKEIAVLKAERDAAVRDLREMCVAYGDTCNICAHKQREGVECWFPDEQEEADDEICRKCDSECPCGHCDGASQWEWRGPQKEEKRI